MRAKTQVLKISELIFDSNLYPRMKTSWLTAYQYAQAMRSGSTFPPIMVGLFEGKHHVIDGWHRVEALKLLREEYIQAQVKSYKDKRDMVAEAIRLNSTHGKPLSGHEKARAIYALKQLNFTREEISSIVKVPIDKLTTFESRVIYGLDGKPIFLKSVTARAAQKSGGSPEGVNQTKFIGRDLTTLLEQIIEMIDADIYPFEDKTVKELTVKLYALMSERLKLATAV